MKKFLSIIMVAAMLVAVFAMVGCGGEGETTASTTTQAPVTTTKAPETTTKAPETTTKAPETTTKAPDTTTEAPVETTTVETTTVETTTTVPTPAETTTATEGTTLANFVVFDWGTKSKAVAKDNAADRNADNYRNVHGFLTNYLDPDAKLEEGALTPTLSYDKSYISVTFDEDTMKVYAKQSHDDNPNYSEAGAIPRDSYAVKYDLYSGYEEYFAYDGSDGKLGQGFGSWQNAPISTAYVGVEGRWQGRHQYAKLRIKNPTDNNIISIMWGRNDAPGNYTNSVAMYLQGGAPTSSTDDKRTTTASTEFKVYYYDMVFHSALARDMARGDSNDWENGLHGYYASAQNMLNKNNYHQNNWNTGNGSNINQIHFYFLGACGGSRDADKVTIFTEIDTRTGVEEGDYVEVDYIVFGNSIEALESYKSNLEG